MNNSGERDYDEEAYNERLMHDPDEVGYEPPRIEVIITEHEFIEGWEWDADRESADSQHLFEGYVVPFEDEQ